MTKPVSEPTEAMIDAAMVAFGDTELVGYDFTRRAVTRAVEAALADTHRAAPTDAVEALTFYATEWTRVSTALGLAGPDKIITHRLACDYGQRAKDALAAMPAPKEPSQ